MNNQWLKARQTKYSAYVTIYIAAVLLILVVANILANRYNRSFDSTANRRNSLSGQTAKIVKDLTQDATITYFGRAPFAEAKDLLGRYQDLSHKVQVKYVDPVKDPLLARSYNIMTMGTSVVEVGNRKEQARSLSEEEITGALIRATSNAVRTVCFTTGSGEYSIDGNNEDSFSVFKQLLEKENYTTKSINLVEKPEIPSDCTVVVVGGPKRDYPQPVVDSLKKYVEGGGRALVMLEAPMKIGRNTIADNAALASLLESWGVTPDKDLILDQKGQMVGQGPQFVVAGNYGQHPIVKDLVRTATGFPLSRSLEIGHAGNTTVQPLVSSSTGTFAITKLDSPTVTPKDAGTKPGPLPIAAAGTFNTGQTKENANENDNAKPQGRFAVFGSAGWAAGYIGFEGNHDLALNTVDWLSSEESLISIRPKAADDRPLTMNNSQMTLTWITSIGLIPFVMIVFGLTVWARRR